MKHIIRLCIILVALALPIASWAQEKSFYFTDWQSDVYIQSDGSVHVAEEFTISFWGSFSWFERAIATPGRMRVRDISVYDHKNSLDVTNESDITETGYSTIIRVNHSSIDESRTWTVRYTADNVINNFFDYDELYWNAVPDDRGVLISVAKARVHLPKSVDREALQYRLYTGYYGDDEFDADFITVLDDKTIEYSAYGLGAYENFTLVAGFPKGLVPDPPRITVTSSQKNIDLLITHKGKTVYTGTAPTTLYVGEDVPNGALEVQLTKFGYETTSQTVRTPETGTQTIYMVLEPTWWYRLLLFSIFVIGIAYFTSPILFFALLYFKWNRSGRDPAGRQTIVPQYEPYQHIRPGVMGTVLDEKADLEDITSTIIDLAIRGYFKIIDQDKKQYEFKLLRKNYQSDKTLLAYEKYLLDKFFSEGKKDVVKLSSLRYTFVSYLATLRDLMYQATVDAHLFVNHPEKVRTKYRRIAWVTGLLGFGLCFVYFLGVPILAYGIILFIFARAMPRRTQNGVDAVEWSKGLKMYLHHAERYRLQNLTPDIFETMLPYAMVFGVEKDWAKQFQDIFTQPPDWYEGTGTTWTTGFAVTHFTNVLSGTMVKSMTTTLTATRSSSGGSYSGAAGGFSGFSGGGFSGGGFGGGGFRAG